VQPCQWGDKVRVDGHMKQTNVIGPLLGDCCEEECNEGEEIPFDREVRKANTHLHFILEDTDLSDFSDSVQDLREVLEQKAIQKVKRRHKKKACGGVKPLPLVTSNLVHLVELAKGRGKRTPKQRDTSTSSGTVSSNCNVEDDGLAMNSLNGDGGPIVMASPPSGLHLILDE
jgi:hypothetical protein